MANEEKEKRIVHVKDITLNLTKPLNFKGEKMELNRLMVLVGANGSGKTLFLVNTWCLCSIVNIHVISLKNGIDRLKSLAQFTYDGSFTDQKFHGRIRATCEHGVKIDLRFNEGKVIFAEVKGLDPSFSPAKATYLSSGMRLFSSISQYLKVRKLVAPEKPRELTPDQVGKMIENFKLYDVTYIESLIVRTPIKITGLHAGMINMMGNENEFKSTEKLSDTDDEFDQFNVDLERCDFYAENSVSKSRKYLSTYGSGHQAAINMMIANQ